MEAMMLLLGLRAQQMNPYFYGLSLFIAILYFKLTITDFLLLILHVHLNGRMTGQP